MTWKTPSATFVERRDKEAMDAIPDAEIACLLRTAEETAFARALALMRASGELSSAERPKFGRSSERVAADASNAAAAVSSCFLSEATSAAAEAAAASA